MSAADAYREWENGHTALGESRYEKAERHASAAIAELAPLPPGGERRSLEPLVHELLALILRDRGRFIEACHLLRAAIDGAAQSGDGETLARCTVAMIVTLQSALRGHAPSRGMQANLRIWLARADLQVDRSGAHYLRPDLMHRRAMFYSGLGDHHSALDVLRRQVIPESIARESAEMAIARFSTLAREEVAAGNPRGRAVRHALDEATGLLSRETPPLRRMQLETAEASVAVALGDREGRDLHLTEAGRLLTLGQFTNSHYVELVATRRRLRS